MMALAPSPNTNNNCNGNKEKIHDEYCTMKKLVIEPEQISRTDTNNLRQMMTRTTQNERNHKGLNIFNANAGSRLSFNLSNTQNIGQSEHDDTIVEQVYHFQNIRDGIPTTSTHSRNTAGMPFILNSSPSKYHNCQLTSDNCGIQLPLIETNQTRSTSRTVLAKRTQESLGVLPLKRQRNPVNSTMTFSSEDGRQNLIHLTEYERNSPTPQFSFRPSTSKVNEIPTLLRTHNSSEAVTSVRYNDSLNKFSLTSCQSMSHTPTIEPFQVSNNRIRKGTLSRPSSTPDSTADKKITHRLIIQDGVTKDLTEDFRQFQKFYCAIWTDIMKIFPILEKLMLDYFVPVALVNGEKVAELVRFIDNTRKPTLEELLNTIINRHEVDKLIKQPGRRFIDKSGKNRAATIIQAYWRGFHARTMYKYLKKRRWAAHIIASNWLKYFKLSKIRKQLKSIRRRQLHFFQKKQCELREQWSHISSHRRILVHIPSLGFTECIRKTLNNLFLKENYQIGRLCEIEDSNIDVIYVSPMPVNDEILQYYDKLKNLRALVEKGSEQFSSSPSNDTDQRFTIIVPEALNRFSGHNMCLSTLLKYSPKALKQIKNLIKDHSAYIVSGIAHVDDLYLAEYLDIPIYGCEPELSYLYSTKSGSKRIFKSSNVPIPYGEYDIYNQNRLIESLAHLIVEHPEIQRWIFKIDDNFDGLGIAYCDIAIYLSCYNYVLKEAEKFADKWSDKSVQKTSFTKVLSELPSILNKYAVYVNKTQFQCWDDYLKVFLSEGGIVEAYPPSNSVTSITVCLSIEPDGNYSLVCCGDQLHAESQFSCWGLSFPQTSVDSNRLNTYCSAIVEQCKQRNIYGYIDIDFITFIDKKTKKQKLWVIDLCIGYSEHISLSRVLQYTTTGQFNSQTHKFSVKMKQMKQHLRNWQNGPPEYIVTEKSRYAIWSSKLYHRNLSNLHYSIFFELCRTHGIGFDVQQKQGTIFTLYEAHDHQHIGMITIGDTLKKTLSNFACYLNTIYQEITPADMQDSTNFMLAVNHIENILGVDQETTSTLSINSITS